MFKRLERARNSRQQAENSREEKFASTVNVYRDMRDNENGKILEPFKRQNRKKLFFGAALFSAIFLHFQTGWSLTLWCAVCVPIGIFLARYNERLRRAANKRPIPRHYD
ncbi:hypothetical protein ASE23_01875 [Rhizobium sp. Root73]|uniref:hypothetical protein n=1 Tax=Rhizobium sp. LjRoot98 TaxID=3342345 RepID=UPI000714C4A0|nr:hypothetical protein ASC96_04975 [Rhizobium sp. Root1204]KQY17431.1 hypothetical protein ASD36_01875 [Rhizobium sp. Root1334]KRC13312.1 hypothetical protein ASE23_01875 [Rhizobium sp. Root73]